MSEHRDEETSFQRLLSLGRSLHIPSNGPVDSLSLRQLVPVHASLCQAVVHEITKEDHDAFHDEYPQLLQDMLSPKDRIVYNRIQQEGTDSERLLVLQYLLHNYHRLQGLAVILIPYLSQPTERTDDLIEAMLDAVIIRNDIDDQLYLSRVLTHCQTMPTTTTCRILVRLHQLGYSVHASIFNLILQSIADTSNSFKAVTSWLLPLLYNDTTPKNVEQTNTLWIALFNSHDPLVVSAVLCGILPHLLESELPMQDNIAKRPLYQPLLWNFIYSSLQPDTMIIPKSSPARGQDTAANNSQTLRRRALYLLRILVEQQETILWNTYVACFETLEMETEPHLIDQVWDSVRDLCRAVSHSETTLLPPMTWSWMAAMLCRLFLADTPVLRKLACYRLFSSTAGIQVGPTESVETLLKSGMHMEPPKRKHSIKAKKSKQVGASLAIVSCDFFIDVILPSYDTLGPSIGTNMQYEHNGKIQSDDMIPMFSAFIMAYVQALPRGERIKEFLSGIFSQRILCRLRTKSALLVYRAVANAVSTRADVIVVDESMILTAISSFGSLFSAGSVVVTFRQGLLEAFAQILSLCKTQSTMEPKTILKVLMLFPMDDSSYAKKNATTTHPHLQRWLLNMMESSLTTMSITGSACAAAFVAGQLLPNTKWDPRSGSLEMERHMGAAIVLLCALTKSASGLLWPAINKALSGIPPMAPLWYNADRVSRALILLEHGCRMELLSGLGNGDLIVDRKTHQMMPPPPSIEAMLSTAISFLIHHIKSLTSATVGDSGFVSGSTRSGNTTRISTLFAYLISQLKVFHDSYPSSTTVSDAADELYKCSITQLTKTDGERAVVTSTALSFAALTCGANSLLDVNGATTTNICLLLLQLEYTTSDDSGLSKSEEQTARSIFHYARWGALSCILPPLLEINKDCSSENHEKLTDLLNELFRTANDLVQATPVDALLPLFVCVVSGANTWFSTSKSNLNCYAENLAKIISSLFDIMEDISNSETSTYMLNELCGLIFRPSLLIDEAEKLEHDEEYIAPIRNAFHRLLKMAGTLRSYISKAVLCRTCGAWLGFETQSKCNAGVGAIPYRQDLIQLLVQKEAMIDESSTNQSVLQSSHEVPYGAVEVPVMTSDSSTSRAFVLVFLSKLPNVDDGLDKQVLSELLHYLVIHLLDDIILTPLKGGAMIMTGSEDYSTRIRAWQALCILSRFVSREIAEQVCNKVFNCMSQNLHGQVRFFLEVFTIQCARQHPAIFAKRLVIDIQQHNLSLQHISSLMIIGGNLIVGQHRLEFFSQYDDNNCIQTSLKEVLSGVIPWLSSTQGFSRCIAQLLVFELIPKVVDLQMDQDDDKDWYLRTLHAFLLNNSEMKRLRTKQTQFFDRYDCESVCTPEGLMCIKVDESDEANPTHLVDAIKKCLEEIYLEAHEADVPMWKQVEEMTIARGDSIPEAESDQTVNFQRKIIPLDSLSLAIHESREKQSRNASGRKRQQLIVCASLIDKVPNLAGLARTAEIFAAERLVVPDISVCKMDNFKSISVGAGEWIKIEECKENVSLKYLGLILFLPND